MRDVNEPQPKEPTNDSQAACDETQNHLERALNLELPIIAVLAEKTMTLEEVLALRKEAVISFEKLNNEPLELYVNDCIIGTGRVIKSGEKFGVWIGKMNSAKETIEKLA